MNATGTTPGHAQISPAAKVYLAGHTGLVGAALHRELLARGQRNVVVRTHREMDLTCQKSVADFFAVEKPQYVFLAAAKVGGIHANNTFPADFIRDNLLIQTNVIDAAFRHGAKKLVFLGSSCIYPKFAPQPIVEEALLSGALEPTNDAYAVAKIAGLKMCQAYRRQYGFDAIALMPTNLYGPNDNFDAELSHVVPAMIRRFHEALETDAKLVTIWGSGTPRREFLHVSDLADAACFLLNNYSSERPINVGVGNDISIMELAKLIAVEVGYRGAILTDASKPDGTPRKLLDVTSLFQLGWRPKVELQAGIRSTYHWYKTNSTSATQRLVRTV
jgi:GDP-L-fucose synthase